MSSPRWMSLGRHFTVLSAAAAFSLGVAFAQFQTSSNHSASVSSSSDSASNSAGESSSTAWQPTDENLPAIDLLAAVPAAGRPSAGQYDSRGGRTQGLFSHLAFEAGAGGNAPVGNSSNYVTWGGNFTVGGGYAFNPRFSVLAEYQFIDDKLPGKIIAETGANGGNAHIWSLGLEPVVDLFPKKTNDVYVTGGGGFYRKVTNFTDPQESEYCTYYYCAIGTENVVVGHFSSNQGGWNIGGGFQRRLGGAYGDGKMKLFAEARYLDVRTPAVTTAPNGLGTTTVAVGTRLAPVTLGVRW